MTKPAPKPANRYFRSIDGLRLLASINIVLLHLEGIGGLNDLNGAPAWLFRIIKGPAFHASLFFMLGGFIFTIKFAKHATEFKTVPFLRKRFSELFPLHAITTLIMVALFAIKHASPGSLDVVKLIYSGFIHLSLLYSFFPFSSYTLNTPSWALSAFFLCYLLFGIVLKYVVQLRNRKILLFLAFLSCTIPLSWGLLYGALGTPQHLYHFFHIFAPIRFFEFLTGMLMAHFFLLSSTDKKTFYSSILNDALTIVSLLMIYFLLHFRSKQHPLSTYLAYHAYVLPFYILLLYIVASEQGIIARILGLSFIRNIGKSSFYPYLLHIPLISLITYICERCFGYYKFLHRPLNIFLFIFLLYAGSALYVGKFRKKRKPLVLPQQTVKEETPATNKNSLPVDQQKVPTV